MPVLQPSVVVSRSSFESGDPAEIIYSNVSFLNALFDELVRPEEVSPDAFRSYNVDYYLAEINNGGFAQFVFNSRWNESVVTMVRDGLEAIGVAGHLALFDEASALVASLGPERLEKFFDGDFFGEDPERDHLNALNDRLLELLRAEDLLALNAAWLRARPQLMVLDESELDDEIDRIAEAVPDRADRLAQAEADRPEFEKIIRALCDRAGHEFVHVTAGDPTHEHAGKPVLAWHFITDHGQHYMIEADGKALMFKPASGLAKVDGKPDQLVAEQELPNSG